MSDKRVEIFRSIVKDVREGTLLKRNEKYARRISKHRYPGIAKAALEMAYDNGGVNRDRPERVTIKELDMVLSRSGLDIVFDFQAINDWLAALPDEQLVTAVAGEHSEVQKLMKLAPAGTDELLNAIFDDLNA